MSAHGPATLDRPVDVDPLVLVMVGKPARGKSYTARKLAGYLSWLGYAARVFNVGAYRRSTHGPGQDHRFFDPDNPEGVTLRRALAEGALVDALAFLKAGGDVAIYDATNSTRARRDWVRQRVEVAGHEVVFLEIVCDDAAVVEANIRATKLASPDYAGRDSDEALADFRQRLAHYERVYEPVTEPGVSLLRLIDGGERLEVQRIRGFLPGRLATFLLNLHLVPRPILLTRHGQSTFNPEGRVGGDPPLSDAGRAYARRLARFLDTAVGEGPVAVWTSTLQRTRATAAPLERPTRAWRVLDEIDAGAFDGLTYMEIAVRHPAEAEARAGDKLRYRYPRGESYLDVIDRLEPAIIELERSRTPVVVVAHQAVLRALYAYLADVPRAKVPHLTIPLHTVIRLEPTAYGCAEVRTFLGPDIAEP